MKQLNYILSLAAILLIAFSVPADGRSKKKDKKGKGQYDVFLLIGQSNMAGRGNMQAGDELPMDGVYILDGNDQIVPAAQPLNIHSTIRKGAKMQKFQLGGPFAAKIHKETGRPVLLVVNARGATSLEQWMKDADQLVYNQKDGDDPEKYDQPIPQFYSEAVRRARIAMKNGELKAILWHQGEANASAKKVPVYLEKLNVMVESLRKDLGVGKEVPFIAGQLCEAKPHRIPFNKEIVRIGEVIPNGWCALAGDLTSNPDKTHLNRESLIILGERYADIVLKTVYNK